MSAVAVTSLTAGIEGIFSPSTWSIVSSPDLCLGLGTQGATEGVYAPCTECQDNMLSLSV